MDQRFRRIALAAPVLLLLLPNSSWGQPGGGKTSDKKLPDKILIGATLPLTGAESRIGGFYKEGYDLA